ncbi:hypothetical protein Airi02_083550 [Actinoallomurus iriomotensis]|uniref:Uncharacterized protein n=1 Tax=Actinoallomurus iriomotensis TaxID=478107 RepID=A0A9W6W5V8_9ACTN|nr:hypothetical protein Airi02_083550 [Actinoallomurus iriomotensis]
MACGGMGLWGTPGARTAGGETVCGGLRRDGQRGTVCGGSACGGGRWSDGLRGMVCGGMVRGGMGL